MPKATASGEPLAGGLPQACEHSPPRFRPTLEPLSEIRQARRATSCALKKRLVVDQALSRMKSPQNHGEFAGSFIVGSTPREELAEAISCRNLNVHLVLSGDDRDRTGNLLVANQALSQLSYVPKRGI